MMRSIRAMKDMPIASEEVMVTWVSATELERIATVRPPRRRFAESLLPMYKGIQSATVPVK